MYLQNVVSQYRKAFAANDNSASFVAKIPTVTEPVGNGVMALAIFGGLLEGTRAVVLPYGLGSNDDVFDMKIIGWRRESTGGKTLLWLPTTLAVFTCTLGAATGVAGASVLNTELFADTIVMKSATTQPLFTDQNATPATQFRGTVEVYSPADDTVAWIRVPLGSHEKIEFTFDQTTGTPTMNCLVAFE